MTLGVSNLPGANGALGASHLSENGATAAGEDLVPTELTDFSPFLLKIRQARPDVVIGNLAAGGKGVAQPLSPRDREIAEYLGPILAARGLLLVGLDVIGDYVTEVNVTSPTCVREIDAQFGTSIADDLFAVLEQGRH